jgi:hypothetical protein
VTDGRTVWIISAVIEASEEEARAAQEAIARALCTDENHTGEWPCAGRRSPAGSPTSTTRNELSGKPSSLEAELQRTRGWRQSTLIAVVAVALLAILMLGIVAFNAVDDQPTADDRATSAVG